jgi:hypothetical protein
MSTALPKARHARSQHAHWRDRLGHLSAGTTGALALTGAAIWLLPFSRTVQVTVLAHTLLGLAATIPLAWYLTSHWRAYRSYPLTWFKLLGYVAVAVLAACLVSGFVLTWQPVFDNRIGYTWRTVHRWTMVASVLFAAAHVVPLGVRDLRARAAAVRAWSVGALSWTLSPAAAVGVLALVLPAPVLMSAFPAGYEYWKPTNKLYAGNPAFAPSLARTATNGALDPAVLSGSEQCGTSGCHTQIVAEWQPSAHRYAAMDKAFQAIQLTMARQNGPTSTRYCGGCHDPISLFSGAKNISADERQLTGLLGYQEGISCLSCHAVRQTDVRGNAQYVVSAPPRYLGEIEFDRTGSRGWRFVRDFLIRAYPDEHVRSLSKTMFKKPEYCAACHKQFVDEEVNRVGWVQLQNQFDNWRMSHWARNRNDPSKTVECRECHMPLVESTDPAAGDPSDYNRSASDGRHRSHRFLGANQTIPILMNLPGGAEQSRLVGEWLKGRIAIPEIADKWRGPDTPAVSLQLVAPDAVRPGEKVTVRCVIGSQKVGHDFPTGPLDIIQSWIELVVRDDEGRVIYDTGTVDRSGFIEPGSFLFKAEPVDQYGNLIDRHNLWEMVGVRNRRSLFPGFSDTAEFSFVCPSAALRVARGPSRPTEFSFVAPTSRRLTIDARLRYRKIDQFLLNYLRSVGFFPEFQGKPLSSPITDLDAQHAVLVVTGA